MEICCYFTHGRNCLSIIGNVRSPYKWRVLAHLGVKLDFSFRAQTLGHFLSEVFLKCGLIE